MAERQPPTAGQLVELLTIARLSTAVGVDRLAGRGFDNQIDVVHLASGETVVLRSHGAPQAPEHMRSKLLESWGVPAPRLLAATTLAALYEFVPGSLLGDLIDASLCSDEHWRSVGEAYRAVHELTFPPMVAGELRPDQLLLWPSDPVDDLHRLLDECEGGLRRLRPDLIGLLPQLHELTERAHSPLRSARGALLHGDINMWNVIIGNGRAILIDWDEPRIGDPAREVALLDKHSWLFNGSGLPPAFFEGYGHGATEPNTSLHRVIQTLHWTTGPDWASFESQDLPWEMKARARSWLAKLVNYLETLPSQVARLRLVI